MSKTDPLAWQAQDMRFWLFFATGDRKVPFPTFDEAVEHVPGHAEAGMIQVIRQPGLPNDLERWAVHHNGVPTGYSVGCEVEDIPRWLEGRMQAVKFKPETTWETGARTERPSRFPKFNSSFVFSTQPLNRELVESLAQLRDQIRKEAEAEAESRLRVALRRRFTLIETNIARCQHNLDESLQEEESGAISTSEFRQNLLRAEADLGRHFLKWLLGKDQEPQDKYEYVSNGTRLREGVMQMSATPDADADADADADPVRTGACQSADRQIAIDFIRRNAFIELGDLRKSYGLLKTWGHNLTPEGEREWQRAWGEHTLKLAALGALVASWLPLTTRQPWQGQGLP